MMQKELVELLINEFNDYGMEAYKEKRVRVDSAFHVVNADIYIPDVDVAIEVKSESGDVRKGIGQALEYMGGGHRGAVFCEGIRGVTKEALTIAYEEYYISQIPPVIDVSVDNGDIDLYAVINSRWVDDIFTRMSQPHLYDDIDKTVYDKHFPQIELFGSEKAERHRYERR